MSTHLADSIYGTTQAVTITAKDLVYASNGAFLGDVEGMTQLGWEFTPQEETNA